MPSRSRPSTPAQFEREKPYDQSTDQSEEEEDFVNASVTPRPSSRTSAASGGSRSRQKHHSNSSSESVDTEEERELQAELQDAAGTETGVVRGAPIESVKERVMRSVGKGSNQSAQRYASLQNADLEAGAGGRKHRHHHHQSSRSRSSRSKSGATAYSTGKQVAPAPVQNDAGKPANGSRTKKFLLYAIGGIILLLLVAAIVAAVVYLVKRNKADDSENPDSPSNSTSLNDHGNSTDTSNSTALDHASSSGTRLPASEHGTENASPTNSFDDGQYRPSTASAPSATGTLDGHSAIEQSDAHVSEGLTPATESVSAIASDHSVDSLVVDPLQTGQTSAPAPTITTQSYGIPAPVESASVDGAAAAASQVPDQVAQPGASPSPVNAGQWNPLSNDDSVQPAATQLGGGAEAIPSSNVAFGGGIGPVVPSATASPQPEGTIAPGTNGPVPEGENAQSSPIGTDATQSSWNQGGGEAQAVSPVDSNVDGAFKNVEFKVATHPESFQTYVDVPATYFESSGHYGSCGIAANNTDYVVAINNALWLNSTQGSDTARSPHCGAEVLLTSMKDGATVNAFVTDRCAYCKTEGVGSIDLSKAAFAALAGGSTDLGSLNIVWGFTGNFSSPVGSNSTIENGSTPALAGQDVGANSTETSNATSTSEDSGWFWRRQTSI